MFNVRCSVIRTGSPSIREFDSMLRTEGTFKFATNNSSTEYWIVATARRFVNTIQRNCQLPPVRPCGGIRYNINPTGTRSKGENSIWTGIRGAAAGGDD